MKKNQEAEAKAEAEAEAAEAKAEAEAEAAASTPQLIGLEKNDELSNDDNISNDDKILLSELESNIEKEKDELNTRVDILIEKEEKYEKEKEEKMKKKKEKEKKLSDEQKKYISKLKENIDLNISHIKEKNDK